MKDRDLNEIKAFWAVAQTQSYTEAASYLGLPKSNISRKITSLESRLGLQLIHRTTRRLHLTDDGRRYFEVCEQALGALNDVEASFEESKAQPQGHLRLTCPVEFGPLITRKVCETFLIKYPNVSMEILATNSVLDLVKDQIDVAIRPSKLALQDMISANLGSMCWNFYASPKWLRDNQRSLRSPEDLKRLDMVAFNPTGQIKRNWQTSLINAKGKDIRISFRPRFVAGSLSVLIEALIAGSGVAALPDFLAHEYLTTGELKRVLPHWNHREESIWAVYQSKKHLPSRTRALVDYLKSAGLFKG